MKVMWREEVGGGGDLVTAPLEFDKEGRPYAIYEIWSKNGRDIFEQKVPLLPALLEKIANSEDYIYKGVVQEPEQNEN